MPDVIRVSAAILGSLLAASCAWSDATFMRPEPGPEPGYDITSGPGRAVMAEANGVVVQARIESWAGFPPTLGNEATPIEITLRNESGRPLRLRLHEFQLVADRGSFLARPPEAISGNVYVKADSLPPPPDLAAPPGQIAMLPDIPPAGAWPSLTTLPEGPTAQNRMAPPLQDVALPSQDMFDKALPMGSLASGAQTQGFLYFDTIPDDRAEILDLQVKLVDAQTGRMFGSVVLPLSAGNRPIAPPPPVPQPIR